MVGRDLVDASRSVVRLPVEEDAAMMTWLPIKDCPRTPAGLMVFVAGKNALYTDPTFYLSDGTPVYYRRVGRYPSDEAFAKLGITHFAHGFPVLP